MTVDNDYTSHDDAIADADLVLRTRSGDAAAFGELWRRHYPSGMTVARSITSSIDPDDLVQESYTRIYQAILKGGGPNGSFRAYLFTSIRNTAAAWGRARRESTIDELETVADPGTTEQATNEALDRGLTAQAFRSLPSRWQEVLWYTEIEQMKPQEVGPLLGMKAGAVSQLAFRAREGLREAWIQAHLRNAEPGSDCQWTIEHLGAYSRGNLSSRDHKRLEQHLDECARCLIVAAEAKDVSTRLALVLLPLVLGITGASGYLVALQSGGAPVMALAAMPSSVTSGAVTSIDGSGIADGSMLAGVGSGAAGGGTGSGGGAGGGGGGAASGGVFGSMGALVGVGSAALLVAGVVVAAVALPTLVGSTTAASLSNTAQGDSSSISSDVGPDQSMSTQKAVDEEEDALDDEPETPPVDATLEPAPSRDEAPATSAPLTPRAPEPIVQPDPEKPETVDPEPEAPGPVEPEPEVPGPVDPEPEPEEPLAVFDYIEIWDDPAESSLKYVVVVHGEQGVVASARVSGGSSAATDLAGWDTTSYITLLPTLQEVCDNATVEFAYASDDVETVVASGGLRDYVNQAGLTTWLDLRCATVEVPGDADGPGAIDVPAEEPPADEVPAGDELGADLPSDTEVPNEEPTEPPAALPTEDVVIIEDAPADDAQVDDAQVEETPVDEAPVIDTAGTGDSAI